MLGGSPYVGRHRERGLLREALTSPGRVVLVSGPAGVGKSRLVQEAVREVGTSAVVLRGDCLPLSEPLPLSPFTDVLSAMEDDPRTAAVWRTTPDRLRDGLAGLSSRRSPDAEVRNGRRAEVFASVRGLLAAVGSVVPLALVVEDVQWVDPLTADLLTYLASPTHLRSFSVVVTRRDDPSLDPTPAAARLAAGLGRHPGLVHLALDPLSRPDATVLARSLAGDELPSGDVSRAVDRAEGNPLFLQLLVEHVRDRSDAGARRRLPVRVEEIMLARLGELDELPAQVVTALAVARTDLSEQVLADVTGRPRARLRPALAVLARRGLLRHGDAAVSHRLQHALLEDAVVDGLTHEALAEWHRRVGRAIARDGGRCDLVADHLRDGGDVVAELPWRHEAAVAADRLSFGTQAAQHWVRLCALVDGADGLAPPAGLTRAALFARAARACKQEGRPDQAADLARRGEELLSEADGAATRASLLLSVGHHSTARHQQAGRHAAREALAILERLPPGADQLEAAYDYWFYSQGHPSDPDVARSVTRALASAGAQGEPFPRVKLTLALAHLRSAEGARDAAAAILEEARRLLPREARLEERVFVALHRADLYGTWGMVSDVYDRWTTELLEEARVLGAEHSEVMSILRWNVARLLMTTGSLQQAAEVIDPCITADPGPHDDASRLLHCGRAALDLLRGDLEASRRRWDGLPVSDLAETVSEVEPWRVETLLWAGDVDGAVGHARTAYAVVRDRPGARARDRDELIVMAARAVAARVRSVTAAAGEDRELLHELGEDLRRDSDGLPASPRPHLDRLTYDAERGWADGEDEPGTWSAVADACEPLHLAGRAAYARWREVQALHRQGRGAAVLAEPLERALAASAGHRPAHRAVRELAARSGVPLPPTVRSSPLTTRETAVLTWVAQGLTNQQIARRLGISPRTVDVHVGNLMRKLGATSRLQAVLAAQRLDLVDTAGPA